MSLTLTADITATARTLTVTGTVPAAVEPGYRFRLDDELLEFTTFVLHDVAFPSWTEQHQNPQAWKVLRGRGGTVAAPHSAGATIEAVLGALVAAADDDPLPDPFASGGGGSLPTGWTQDPETGAVDTGGQGFNARAGMVRAFTITPADVLAGEGAGAAVGVADSGNDALIGYVADEPGLAGHLIAVLSDVQPSVGALTVTVDGTIITVHLETDGDSVVLSTYDEVFAAVRDDPTAAALVINEMTGGLGGANVLTEPYNAGDIYLGGATTNVVLTGLDAGDVIWDAQVFFPTAWDASTAFATKVGDGADVFYDGDPDPEVADDTNNPSVAVAQTETVFNTAKRIRLTEDGDLYVVVSCEAGAVPTEGEMLLMVDVRTPA